MHIVDISRSDLVTTHERLERARIDCYRLDRAGKPRKRVANYFPSSTSPHKDSKGAPGRSELACPERPTIAANVVCDYCRAILLRSKAVDLESGRARHR